MQNPTILPASAQLSYGNGHQRTSTEVPTIIMEATVQLGKDTDNLNGAVHQWDVKSQSRSVVFYLTQKTKPRVWFPLRVISMTYLDSSIGYNDIHKILDDTRLTSFSTYSTLCSLRTITWESSEIIPSVQERRLLSHKIGLMNLSISVIPGANNYLVDPEITF